MRVIFRQLQDLRSSTFTYLLADSETREAVLIDPVFEQARRDAALVEELDLKLICTLDTHVHADHVTAAWLHKQYRGSRIAVSAASGAEGADIYLEPGAELAFGSRRLEARPTPGHTNGCMTFVLDGQGMAFTGDALLIRGAGRTDFQQGDALTLYHSVQEQIFTLPEDCMLYPAHDYRGLTATSVFEEKRFNPRLGGDRSAEDFVGYMSNLNLPHPKQIEAAVPANLRCGEVEPDKLPETSVWAPLHYTYAGIYEIEPDWLAEHRTRVQIVDVRGPSEFTGILGHIEGARMIPLSELEGHMAQLDRIQPVVTVCRSGARSAQAAILLAQRGFERVASLAGGMINWCHHGLPVHGRS